MSNGLRRKTSSTQASRMIYPNDWKLAEKCFASIFASIQLICFTTLYSSKEDGGFDFSRQKLKNFNKYLTQHNQDEVAGSFDSKEIEYKFRKVGFDCEREAAEFPYRAKVKMYGGKLKTKHDYSVVLASVNVAIEAYLILAVYTLRKHYGFSWIDIRVWWEKCKEIAGLYAEGMTDEFVMKFIKDECDLEIYYE